MEHPYRNGIALIGDAAATSDPTLGEGLSLTLRDPRRLHDSLPARKRLGNCRRRLRPGARSLLAIIHRLETWNRTLSFANRPEGGAPGPCAPPHRPRSEQVSRPFWFGPRSEGR